MIYGMSVNKKYKDKTVWYCIHLCCYLYQRALQTMNGMSNITQHMPYIIISIGMDALFKDNNPHTLNPKNPKPYKTLKTLK
jgi:hypothetical protein